MPRPSLLSVESLTRSPSRYRDTLKADDHLGHTVWVAARSEPHDYGFCINTYRRLRLAWLVFTGRCDAIYWGVNRPEV